MRSRASNNRPKTLRFVFSFVQSLDKAKVSSQSLLSSSTAGQFAKYTPFSRCKYKLR